MLKIFVARHGQNEDNERHILNGHRDLPLTAKGREQAMELAKQIQTSGLVFEKIYTSPLIRASETAEIVASYNKFPQPQVLQDLIEREFGIMTGLPIDSIESMCAPDVIKADIITYFLHPEGAETFDDLVHRGKRVLEYVKSMHTDGNILLVGHGDMGKMIMAAYFDIPWKEVLTLFHFGNSELIELSPESHIGDFHKVKIQQHNH